MARSVFLLALLLALTQTACTTVMYVKAARTRTYIEPSYITSRPFFVFGLVGKEQNVYVDDICLGKDVDQIVTLYSPHDVALGIITLGIYSPRSVEVWCEL